jgi:hypothetical protein
MTGQLVELRQRVIHRTRCPVSVQNPVTGAVQHGYGDIWTRDRQRADARAAETPGAFVETLTLEQIMQFEPAAQLKARAAWARAYPED